MDLLTPIALGPRTAPNRVLFGPHVTNLGDGRSLSARHVAYYERRARGGCGTIVVEEASVHDSDWPYERAPRAEQCGEGWARIVAACRPHGALVVAALGHAGGQGSSAYSQRELWAPSRVPEVNTREVPKWMEADDIAAVVAGFAAAARRAVEADCDGVEVNAGQHSLVRQFLSGLTNHRGDEWGQDRLLFARQVLAAVRTAIGPGRVLGLRLSCDELAPWAGITPEQAPALAASLVAEGVDYLVVVRGSIFSTEKTRPDFHEPPGFNEQVAAAVRAAVPAETTVVLQGSVVGVERAAAAVASGGCDAVEMTRAQIADPDLVAKAGTGDLGAIRPCILCNQTCQVRDVRNPVVTCVGEPSSGHETEDPDWLVPTRHPRRVLVVGGGPAGLEAARVAAGRGHDVRLVERSGAVGGAAAIAGPALPLVAWLEAACEATGVRVETDIEASPDDVAGAEVTIVATGSVRGRAWYDIGPGVDVLDVRDVLAGISALTPTGDVVVLDPIGGPIGVALAEELGERAVLVTQDQIAGNELSRTGDLAPANVRLQQRGVRVQRRSIVRAVRAADGGLQVVVEGRFDGVLTTLAAAAVVDAGYRLPDDALWAAVGKRHLRAGDCVAPRTVHEAVLEGRRAALAIDTWR